MKTLRILTFGFLMATAVCQAQNSNPGWFRAATQPLPSQSRSSFTAQQFRANGLVSSGGVPAVPVAEAITPQIQALADGLQDDPVQIFDYVHDHIKFVLYFGAKKGANLTLLEKSGNDFDQSALLVALLSAAGYSNNVQYQFGWQQIPYDDPDGYGYDLHHWWQLTLTNSASTWTNTYNYLFDLIGTRGYPDGYYFNDGNTFEIQRTWVALTINSTTYQLDPAFKISVQTSSLPGFSLTNAMGGAGLTISNAIISAAAGTDNANYAQNLSESAVRNKLTIYATNLLNYLQSNAPNASVSDVLGGWQIVPAYNDWDYSTYTTFPTDTFSGQMPILSWTYEPTNIMSTFRIAFAGTNYQCYMPQLQGQRMALTFDSSGNAQLWQDDTNLAQHTTSGSGTTNVILAVTHPFGSWDEVNNVFIPNPTNYVNTTITNSYQRTNATYAIMYAFEPDWGWLQQRQNMLDTYLQQGLTNGSRQVTCESLNIMGLNWLLQTAQEEQMQAAQIGILPMYFHRIGRMSQEASKGYYVDVYMQFSGEYPNGGDDTAHMQLSTSHFDLWMYFSSALEHGLIEQLQNTNLVGASTVKMLEIANTNGQAVYLASSANWSSIQGSLVNYGSTLTQIYNQFISQGYYVLLPANGSNHVNAVAGNWAGYGYETRGVINGVSDSRMIIAGGYNGGYSSDPTITIDPVFIDTTSVNQPTYFNPTPIFTPTVSTGDPVDTVNDTFEVENTDLSLGQAEPRGINFSRYYNGVRRFNNPAGMAGGWVHNYSITANTIAAPQAGLGEVSPAQAAPMLAATAAAIATYNGGTANAKNWLTTTLIAKWGVDQLTKNGVSVAIGKDTLQFVKQPNGTFTPPANCTATLSANGTAYSLLLRHGNKFNFNGSGLLTNVVDQYGQNLNLTYNSSNWVQTVKDWKSRQFTFNYSGTPSRLTSVTDGTRTISYGYATTYNSQGDLTSFTDAEGKISTYQYDTNHQITATLDALSRLVVSNNYNSQGHITTQYTQGDTNKLWRYFWSGWRTTEFDPANAQTDFYYDDQSRLTAVVDPIGYETDTYYDGQNHIIQTVSAMNETNQFVFDGNNNVVQQIDPLGFTNQFIFDSNNNLVRAIDPLGHTNSLGYNAQFSLTGQTNGAGDWVNSVFNSDGTLYTKTDAGGTTTYGYDSTYRQLSSITYPASLGVEYFTNNAFGDVIGHQNARGFGSAFQYNNRRQLTNSVGPTNIALKASFDAVGNPATATDARGFTSSNLWSATKHLLSTTLPTTAQGSAVLTNIFDNRDKLTCSLDPYNQPTYYTNDINGRLISVTDPLQRTSRFKLDGDGRKLAIINGGNETNKQTWDKRGSLKSLTDGAGHVSSRVYDSVGNQIYLTNRNSKVWQFYFDGAQRLTNTTTPLGRSLITTLNHQGLPILVKDMAGLLTTNGFDAKGRQTNRADSLGSTYFSYDAGDNRTNLVENGKNNAWAFDAYNRVSSYKDASGNLIQYRFDASGNLTNLIYPGNRNVFYAYDSQNHLTNVVDWSNRKTSIGYDLAGRITSITRPNGSVRTIGYDLAGDVTNILEQMGNGLPIAILRHGWTNTGTMSWEFAAPLPHSATVPTRTMTYDDDNRLMSVNGTNTVSDNDGNLTYAPLTNGVFVTQTFDVRNRLVSSGGVTNFYDAADNRIGQNYGTNITTFVVNPNAKLPQVLMRIKNGVTNYYIYGSGLLYQITETATATNTLTYHYDYRGSTIALSGDNGLVTDRIEYSLYALTTYHVGTNDTPFLFNGRYGVMTDPNGMLYMRARYYNPYICRFLSQDPSGFNGGLNWFAYANGNPVNYLDPFGLLGWSDVGDYFEGVGQVFEGYGLAVRDTAVGLFNVVEHPVNTAVGLYNVAANPVQAYNAISTSIGNTWNSGLTGQGEIVGNILVAAGTVGAGTSMGAVRLAGISDTIAEAATDASYAQKLVYYEIGQKTMGDASFLDYADIANPIDRGAQIVADKGWLGALTPESSGWWLGVGKTFATDPTPLGWFGVAGAGAADFTGQLGTYGQQTSFGNGTTSGGK